ncbi:MAG TPA: LIC12162 family protein, partial [Polyangiaceae bacterium]|nr:LIC12162 family protein [Polyangiaceae bacterium]
MPDTERLLITTADERTWRNDRPVLFLGEWCRPYSLRATWERMDAAVVPPYGWREGQQDADYARVQQLYELLLEELGDELNRYHGTTFSRRYWRILIGPWLNTFVAIVFNRWATIQLALERFRISGSLVLDLPDDQVVPSDNIDFIYKWLSHEWNHRVFARILESWTSVPCHRIGKREAGHRDPRLEAAWRLNRGRRLKEAVARRLTGLSHFLSREGDAFLISTYLPSRYQSVLQLSLGQFPSLWRTEMPGRASADPEARKKLQSRLEGNQGVEHCLRTLASEQIPTIYLEGYARLREIVRDLPWPKRPRVIFTSSNMYSDEVFKAWTAERVEQGVPYVIGQHGGVYGAARFTRYEEHEAESADRVL